MSISDEQVLEACDQIQAGIDILAEELARLRALVTPTMVVDPDAEPVQVEPQAEPPGRSSGFHRYISVRLAYPKHLSNLIVDALLAAERRPYTKFEIADLIMALPIMTGYSVNVESVGGSMARLTRAGLFTCHRAKRIGQHGKVRYAWQIEPEAAMAQRGFTLTEARIAELTAQRAA